MSVHNGEPQSATTERYCTRCDQPATCVVIRDIPTPYCGECSRAIVAAGGRDYPLSAVAPTPPTDLGHGVLTAVEGEAWLASSHVAELRDWV